MCGSCSHKYNRPSNYTAFFGKGSSRGVKKSEERKLKEAQLKLQEAPKTSDSSTPVAGDAGPATNQE